MRTICRFWRKIWGIKLFRITCVYALLWEGLQVWYWTLLSTVLLLVHISLLPQHSMKLFWTGQNAKSSPILKENKPGETHIKKTSFLLLDCGSTSTSFTAQGKLKPSMNPWVLEQHFPWMQGCPEGQQLLLQKPWEVISSWISRECSLQQVPKPCATCGSSQDNLPLCEPALRAA